MSEQQEPKVTSLDEGQSASTVGLGAIVGLKRYLTYWEMKGKMMIGEYDLILRGLSLEQARTIANEAYGGTMVWHKGKAYPFDNDNPVEILKREEPQLGEHNMDFINEDGTKCDPQPTESALFLAMEKDDLIDMIRWAYMKLQPYSFPKQYDALMLDRMKLITLKALGRDK